MLRLNAFHFRVDGRARAFICADLGIDTDPFLLHIYAAFAQRERRMISIRTKEGLARAKARGVKLGGANAQSQRNEVAARRRAEALKPILLDIIGDRTDMSATQIAIALNSRRVPAVMKGSKWHATQVIRVMQRLGMQGPEARPGAA